MITLNRILVPHDLSETANAAMSCAATLTETLGARCDVLHVTRLAEAGKASPQRDEQLEMAVRERLRRNGRDATGLDPEFQYRSGIPHEAILAYAKDEHIDLIVMGTHGRGILAHTLLGSVAQKVVRSAPCPVLTVHTAPRQFPGPNVLVPIDFEAASKSALAYGRTLARLFGAKLHVLHVMENYFMRAAIVNPHELEAALRERLTDQLTDDDRRALHATAVLSTSDNPAQALLDYANSSHIDLIVMGTHGRQAMARLLMGSVAERVVRTASCPVLTVRHPEREFVVADG